MGPLIPLFWTSGDICPGFQSQGELLFACFLSFVILRFTSDATPADCIARDPRFVGDVLIRQSCRLAPQFESRSDSLAFIFVVSLSTDKQIDKQTNRHILVRIDDTPEKNPIRGAFKVVLWNLPSKDLT